MAFRCTEDGCQAPPFKSRQALAGHRRTHDTSTVNCTVCGKEVNTSGLGPHMRSHRDKPAPAPAPRAAREPALEPDPTAPLPAAAAATSSRSAGPTELHELLQPDVLERLLAYQVGTDAYSALVIVGATYGPKLIARRYIGDHIGIADQPLIAITIEQLAEAQRATPANMRRFQRPRSAP